MTTEDRLLKEYKTYCCKMNSIIDTDNARYKVMGYGEWKENREMVERREGIEGK